MKLTRIRLVGFKSFVDPSEVVIRPGLTGIVGPNGCGKSNLVEALRWVMGENSYKVLRASEMDDVIFAGTTGRPARNNAEVVVWLDNSAHLAPAPFTQTDELEITRRIEREKGSVYRVNGREVRARDVQLLFADASTGARSPALVRQGQIGEIINAKPEARRRVLEEAAGIAGLHARRHEAELRLKTAEQNLERVEDVLNRLNIQLDSLKRQARQSARYRQLSASIRKYESALLTRAHREAQGEVMAAERAVQEAERLVAARMGEQGEAARAEGVASHGLPGLRDAAAGAAAALERLRRAGDDLDRDERQARERLEELDKRIAQLEADMLRERALASDAAENLIRLDAEAASLTQENEQAADKDQSAAARVEETKSALAEAENTLAAATAQLAERTAQRDALLRARSEAEARFKRLDAEHGKLSQELRAMDAEHPPVPLDTLSAALDEAVTAAAAREQAAAAAEQALIKAREAESTLRAPLAEAEADVRRLEVEAKTLSKVLALDTPALWPAVLDALSVDRGYEAALGAALGDDLQAPADSAAPAHWAGSDAEEDPALPKGAHPLIDHVKAPDALTRRLRQIGVVAREKGAALRAQLKPGQRLVSKEGDLWRWDGYTTAADAPTAAARRLAERNRLAEIDVTLEEARALLTTRKAEMDKAQAAARQAVEEERAARDAGRAGRLALDAAREKLSAAEKEAARQNTRRASVAASHERLTQDRAEAETALQNAQQAVATLPDSGALEQARTTAQQSAERARTVAADARVAREALLREGEARARRQAAIARERESWASRGGGVDEHIAKIETRRRETAQEREEVLALPDTIVGQRRALLSALSEAEAKSKEAADRLASGETARNKTESAAREALSQLGAARETLAREETRREAAIVRRDEAATRLAEALGAPADSQAFAARIQEDLKGKQADSANLSADLDRLKQERDRLGAVNLRAEEELAEVQTTHDNLVAERDDLIEAIRRLRHGVQTLNREGRERLNAAFSVVNEHFKRLFTTLFGGGEAQLELIESDDPLEAGLEVVARPPGKKPQTLSLLSGGEQALTAMALIFAIFLTNPAPICVLDEVDAPLDDANVERFCDLLETMRRDTDTRFLVVTHNPVTMSRMERLFGVTMAERGVSQIVSVDLEEAERILEAI